VATGSYTIAYDTVANPTFSITPGTYNSDQLVGITTNTVGATIYYTTNGTTPTNASTEYTGTAIQVSANGTSLTIKAIAIKPGLLNSAVTIGTFIISYGTVASPSFNLAPGTYTSDQSITISTTTVGATIYYTTDGNTPTTSSSQYVGTPISVSGVGTKTIKALAVKSGMLDSSVASASYTITYPTIGGTVSGLLSGTVVLQNNGGDNLSITANGSFTFPTPVAPGSSYNVTILSQSSTITCKLGNATGSANQNITTITLDCILLGAQWARTTLTGGGLQQFLGVAIKEGSIYAVGEIGGNQTHDFGNSVTITQSFTGANAVIVKYNNNGTPQWAKTIYSTISTASRFDSVAIGSDGSIYAAGMIGSNTTYNLGNSVTVSSSGSCILLVKYDSNGNTQWAKSLVAGNSSSFKSVAVGSDGSVYAVGYLNTLTTYDFGNSITLTPTFIGANAFVVKYNSDGVPQWAKIASGANNTSIFSSVGVGSDNSAYLAGFIQGTAPFNFGNGVTALANNASFSKAILVKYNSSGVAQWAKMGASSGSSGFNSVAIGNDDSIYCFGLPCGTIDFGNSVSLVSSTVGSLLVKYDSNGNAQWAKTSVSTQYNEFVSGVISGNYIYVGGYNNRTVTHDFGNSVVATGGYNGNNTLIVKYDLNGNAIWARTTSSGTKNSRFSSIAVDSDEFVYGAGLIQDGGTINFGNSVTATGLFATNRNAVLVKYK